MKVHIIGGGPSGLSLAWILSKTPGYTPIIYDKYSLIGGSWREPSQYTRNSHSHRIVFKGAYANFSNLLSQMGLQFNDYFKPTDRNASFRFLAKNIHFYDYIVISLLYIFTIIYPTQKSVDYALAKLGASQDCRNVHNTISYAIDGVPSTLMTITEYIFAIDKTVLYQPHDQKVSGYNMCKDFETKLLKNNVIINYVTELISVDLENGLFTMKNPKGTYIINSLNDIIVLCIDAKPLSKLLHNQIKVPTDGIYGSLSIMLSFNSLIQFTEDDFYNVAHNSEWHLLCSRLPDKKTINVVICDELSLSTVTGKTSINTNETELINEVWRQLSHNVQLPYFSSYQMCWGTKWNSPLQKWEHIQSSNVITNSGTLEYNIAPNVFTCGMLSKRTTAFASIESAVESAIILSHKYFPETEPHMSMKHSFQLSHLIIAIVIIFIVILIYLKTTR